MKSGGRVGVKMLYGLFLSLLFGVLLLALWLLLRRHPIWGKRWFRVGSFAFVVLLGIVFLLIPREVRTREYASPEEAFRYKNQGEILLVLGGEQSAYVVAEQGGNSYLLRKQKLFCLLYCKASNPFCTK